MSASRDRDRWLVGWRAFDVREIRAAMQWSDEGGVAVHLTGRAFGQWKITAHLFARDETALFAAADEVGVDRRWIERESRRVHFDIFGVPLLRAVARCVTA